VNDTILIQYSVITFILNNDLRYIKLTSILKDATANKKYSI
jgi:hypothetical protein